MQEYIEKRVIEVCDYMIETGATVRLPPPSGQDRLCYHSA